jgi:hypothetical protein
MRKFIFLPPAVFESRFQRPQALAIELARLNYVVYFPIKFEISETQFHVDNPIKPFFSELDKSDINSQTIRFSHELSMELCQQDVIIVMHPNWQIDEKCQAHIHYDLMDRWWEFENADPSICSLNNKYWLDRADSVTVSSTSLLKDVQNRKDVKTVWNATFPNHVSSNSSTSISNRTRFVYVGAITHWLDFDSINRIAKIIGSFNGELLIIGQIEDPRICALLAFEWVQLMGELRHEEAMLLMNTAVAGLIPFTKTPLTDAVDPIKVYEYLEHGLTVFGLKSNSYNPAIRSHVHSESTWKIIVFVLYIKLRNVTFKRKHGSKLREENYWRHRAIDLLDSVGSRDK